MVYRKQQRPALKKSQVVVFAGMAGFAVIGLTVGAITEKHAPESVAAAPSATASVAEVVATPTATPSARVTASADVLAADEPLTKKNSATFKKVLAASDDDYERFSAFALQHEGETVRFNGVITALDLYGEYTTRYNVLMSPGNDIATSKGPNFHFKDVNITYDLHLTGDNIPDSIGPGQKVRVTATVDSFNEQQGLFELEPVTTEIR